MLSYVVYASYEAFISDDDDVVATVAGGQLILVYFAALAVYISDVSDQREGDFTGIGFGAVLLVIFFASFLATPPRHSAGLFWLLGIRRTLLSATGSESSDFLEEEEEGETTPRNSGAGSPPPQAEEKISDALESQHHPPGERTIELIEFIEMAQPSNEEETHQK